MSQTKLSGADYFFLVIAHHLKKQGIGGMDCRYIMTLDSVLPLERLEKAIQASSYFQLLERTRIQFKKIGVPVWGLNDEKESTTIIEHQTEFNDLPEEIFSNHIPLEERNLFRFDVVQHPTFTTVIFSWHHILLDAFGASRLLISLNDPDTANTSTFFGKEIKESILTQWNNLVFAKNYLKDTTKKPLLFTNPQYKSEKVAFVEKRFSRGQTTLIKQNTGKYSRGGFETPYLLGNMAMAYQQVIKRRGSTAKDIWVPVPMEQRKPGASGPIIGNSHSLLFLRVRASLMDDKKALVKDLSTQFFEQVKLGIPHKYASMLRLLRYLPVSFYYRLIKRPNGESLSGMLYSQSPSHKSLKTFLGATVTDVTALPPNTAPPGISFQITTFDERLKLVVQYSESYFSKSEIENVLSAAERQLTGEDA